MTGQASKISIRPIRQADNHAVAETIRLVMSEFDCSGEGYSCHDPEVHAMFEAYSNDSSVFYVIEKDCNVVGCGGIAALVGAEDDNICELRKMYFQSEVRGLGLGRQLLETCLADARRLGYRMCYLESVERMQAAIALYRKCGFRRIERPLGNTGHSTCDVYMVREVTTDNGCQV